MANMSSASSLTRRSIYVSIWRWLLVAALVAVVTADSMVGSDDDDISMLGTPYRYDLSEIKTSDGEDISPTTGGGKKVISTATNSPIFYIDQLDFSSLFFNLIKPPKPFQTAPTFGGIRPPADVRPQNIRPVTQNKNKKRRKRPTTTTTTTPVTVRTTTVPSTMRPVTVPSVKPMTASSNWTPPTSTIQVIPLPFVSNAKPIGYYKLRWTPSAMMRVTTTKPTTIRTTTEPSTTTTTLATTTTTEATTTTTTTHKPIPNSKIIRLKTKFLANGRPSAVYMYNSPHRRYSLKDLIRGSSVQPSDENMKAKPTFNRNKYRPGSRHPLNNTRKNTNSSNGNRNRWWWAQSN